jgi:hypothetical protein
MTEDRTATERRPNRRRVTVAEAAEILGITAEAVRTRIKRDKLDSVKEPPGPRGTVYVLLEADKPDQTLTLHRRVRTKHRTKQNGGTSSWRRCASRWRTCGAS